MLAQEEQVPPLFAVNPQRGDNSNNLKATEHAVMREAQVVTVLQVQRGSSTHTPPPPTGDSGTINKLEEELEKALEKITKLEELTKQLQDALEKQTKLISDQAHVAMAYVDSKAADLNHNAIIVLRGRLSKLEDSVEENTKQTTTTPQRVSQLEMDALVPPTAIEKINTFVESTDAWNKKLDELSKDSHFHAKLAKD